MSDTSTPAITCQNVWQVFGAHADSALKQALSETQSAEEAAAALRAKGLTPAVQDATFEVKEGELFVIMGLSGSGTFRPWPKYGDPVGAAQRTPLAKMRCTRGS